RGAVMGSFWFITDLRGPLPEGSGISFVRVKLPDIAATSVADEGNARPRSRGGGPSAVRGLALPRIAIGVAAHAWSPARVEEMPDPCGSAPKAPGEFRDSMRHPGARASLASRRVGSMRRRARTLP